MQTPSSMCEQPKILLFSQESGCSTKKLAGNVQKSERKCLSVDVMSVIPLKTSKDCPVKSGKWM